MPQVYSLYTRQFMAQSAVSVGQGHEDIIGYKLQIIKVIFLQGDCTLLLILSIGASSYRHVELPEQKHRNKLVSKQTRPNCVHWKETGNKKAMTARDTSQSPSGLQLETQSS